MKKFFKHIFITLAIMIVTACGGGDSENSDESRSGGVCFGSGTTFICQGRVCTKSGNGVICPDGQYCPMAQNLSVTYNPVCARRD